MREKGKGISKIISIVVSSFSILLVFLSIMITKAFAATASSQTINPDIAKWGFLTAALSTGISTIAAGIAVAYVGSAAIGAISEKPELTGRVLIFVGLAEGIAIYGLIISIMILGKI